MRLVLRKERGAAGKRQNLEKGEEKGRKETVHSLGLLNSFFARSWKAIYIVAVIDQDCLKVQA